MARPIWKGHISFGLVNIPIALQSAENRKNALEFRLLDRRDRGRIRYERINETTGKSVPWNEIVKAHEYEPGEHVLLTDRDFKKAAVEATQTIEIDRFVGANAIAPVYFERPYYIVPDKKGEKGYALLREALIRTGTIGIAAVVLRSRQHLAALVVHENALMLDLLRFHDELLAPGDLGANTSTTPLKLSAKEIDLAKQLVTNMSGDWRPQEYHDEYRNLLFQWIQRRVKAGGRDIDAAADVDAPERASVINIMDLLKQSIEGGGRRRAAVRAARRKPAIARRRAKSA